MCRHEQLIVKHLRKHIGMIRLSNIDIRIWKFPRSTRKKCGRRKETKREKEKKRKSKKRYIQKWREELSRTWAMQSSLLRACTLHIAHAFARSLNTRKHHTHRHVKIATTWLTLTTKEICKWKGKKRDRAKRISLILKEKIYL